MTAPAVQQGSSLPFAEEAIDSIHLRYWTFMRVELARTSRYWYGKEAAAHRAIRRLRDRCKEESADVAQCVREIENLERELKKYELVQAVLLGFQARDISVLSFCRTIEARARRSIARRRESAQQGEYDRRFRSAREQLLRDDLCDILREMQCPRGGLADFLMSKRVQSLIQRWLLELSGLPLPAEGK
jgi:hypothetical protein